MQSNVFKKLIVTTRKIKIVHHCLCQMSTKKLPTNLNKWSKSSQEWMTRHINDPYVKRAKMENYRARSAFKLIEMDDKHKFFHPGQLVVDCGASPGAWTQVAVKRTNAINSDTSLKVGKVVSVDINYTSPIDGAVNICGDFTHLSVQKMVIEQFGGLRPDVILSDMAPNASGVANLDNENIVGLALVALSFSIQQLKVNGTFLCKVWDGGEVNKLELNMEKFFSTVRRVKPLASRANSAEVFILGKHFKGLSPT